VIVMVRMRDQWMAGLREQERYWEKLRVDERE
jgi:hypothetical protein